MTTEGQIENEHTAPNETSDNPDESTGIGEAPMCRICFRGANSGSLLSPCNCKGSIGLVHRACLEEWLSARNTTECCICSYQFVVEKRPKSVWEWLTDSSTRVNRWYILVDTTLSLFGAAMLIISAWLSAAEIVSGISSMSGCVLILLIVLLAAMICFVDIYLMIKHHRIALNHWRQDNWHMHVVLPDDNVPQETTTAQPSSSETATATVVASVGESPSTALVEAAASAAVNASSTTLVEVPAETPVPAEAHSHVDTTSDVNPEALHTKHSSSSSTPPATQIGSSKSATDEPRDQGSSSELRKRKLS
ncbi:E3 ubiquitin-protein ligase MARCHF2-like [Ornithodoros turicata]|uniref:E3 ubiquitin-protein ligase MARCHF2-like n=1 Tax=Ornithodoros turicata TaxID=34597 RepID=UPI003139D7F0